MPKSLYDRGMLRPHEVERLKRVFDQACAKRQIRPETEDARELALRLLALHNAGMVDEDMLMSAVAFAPPAVGVA